MEDRRMVFTCNVHSRWAPLEVPHQEGTTNA
jgi:hypothetical protein